MIKISAEEEQICQIVYSIATLRPSLWWDNINYSYFETKCSEECGLEKACTAQTHTRAQLGASNHAFEVLLCPLPQHIHGNQSELSYETNVRTQSAQVWLKELQMTYFLSYLLRQAPWHGASSGCGWRRRPPDMDGSSEYVEQAVADSRQILVSSLGVGRGAKNSSP
jgi:hypothetical protein